MIFASSPLRRNNFHEIIDVFVETVADSEVTLTFLFMSGESYKEFVTVGAYPTKYLKLLP